MEKLQLFAVILFVSALLLFSYWQFFVVPPDLYPPGLSNVEKAAVKAGRIEAEELQDVIEALKNNDGSKVVYGDRFMRWTVLAYTLWRIDRGGLTILETMKDLMISYYNHAWYPYVKNRPLMPFDSLIQYFRADGTWEDYWCDYKPVYVAAFMLEYYVLSCYDHDWGVSNYGILKNVSDSLLKMWLPSRHQPCAYVDAQGAPGTIQMAEIKNITCSVDSAFIYAALISSAQISKILMNDAESYEIYMEYANDLITHFYNQTWDWFPTNIFGSNPGEPYGTALQIGMTLPCIDGDERIDVYEEYLVNNLRVGEDSWLLKWKESDVTVSSRSVFAAIGLAPRYAQIAFDILDAYAEEALSSDPWLLTETDGYEGKDPVWVAGKYLEAYVFMKNRMLLGRIPYSPRLMKGDLAFETSFPSDPAELNSVNSTFPTLLGVMQVKAEMMENDLNYVVMVAPQGNMTIRFYTLFEPEVSCNATLWGYVFDKNANATVVWFVPNGGVEIKVQPSNATNT